MEVVLTLFIGGISSKTSPELTQNRLIFIESWYLVFDFLGGQWHMVFRFVLGLG